MYDLGQMFKLAKIFSAVTFMLGVTAVGIGCHAYFESPYNKQMFVGKSAHDECQKIAVKNKVTCPSLSLEIYFISTSILTLILSSAYIIARFIRGSESLMLWSSSYYFGAALLLLIGGVIEIVSASQIYYLMKYFVSRQSHHRLTLDRNSNQYYDEKIVAGIISLLNSVMFFFAGIVGLRTRALMLQNSL